MSCKYCEENAEIETKKDYAYHTHICGNQMIVCKRYKHNKYIAQYSNNIKYCPMCGKKLGSDKGVALSTMLFNGKIYLSEKSQKN